MAILDIFSGLNTYWLYGGSSILVIIFIAVVIFWWRRRNAERESWLGWREEREENLGPYARSDKQIVSWFERLAQRAKQFGIVEKLQEKLARKFKGALKAVRAVEDSAEASEHEEEVQKAGAAIEGRSIGIEASLKKIARALIWFALKKRKNTLNEQLELTEQTKLINEIQELANAPQIDERFANYLRGIVARLTVVIQNDLATEEEKKKIRDSIVPDIEKAVDVMKNEIKKARIVIGILQRERRKARKYSNRELVGAEESLKKEEKALEELDRGNKDEPTVIVQLRRELDMKWEQLRQAKKIGRQLEATYAFMRRAGKEMRRVLKYVLANEKSMKRFDDLLEDLKKEADQRLAKLRQAFAALQQVSERFGTTNINEATLALASALREYFRVYQQMQSRNISFDATVRDIAIKNFVISQQMRAFQQLMDSLTQSEKAADAGISAITELISGLVNEASKENIAHEVESLKESTRVLNYEGDIVSYMKSLARTLESKSRELTEDLQFLINKDKEISAQIASEELLIANGLGRAIAKVIDKKIAFGVITTQQSSAFQQQLQQKYAQAAAGYNQAMRREALAQAA